MRTADKTFPAVVSAAELNALFSGLEQFPALLLAVSGGPDSTALMVLAARWRDAHKKPPKLIAATVDHGLRPESKAEAAGVAKLARKLKIPHRTLRWTGRKPKTGMQQAARAARYRLLAEAARKAGASHILTAHTRDDQAETVLIRMTRGSGITGLGAMQRITVIPGRERSSRARNPCSEMPRRMESGPGPSGRPGMTECEALHLVRPFLDVPKACLVATLKAAKIPFADDPSNRDPRFTRARLRGLMPVLTGEGLDPARLALLARRMRRAEDALVAAAEHAWHNCMVTGSGPAARAFDVATLVGLPAEIGLRVIGRAVAETGSEGPVELAKLEALKLALDEARKRGGARFRRSLAGAIVTLTPTQILVERAPPRRSKALTKRQYGAAAGAKLR